MNVEIMMDELIKELEAVTGTVRFLTPKGEERAPQVVDSYLPPKNPRKPDDGEDFPYVIVRYMEDEETENDATAKVKIICGVHAEEIKQGLRDLLNLTGAIRTHFLSQRLFGGCFEVKMPLKREIPEEQNAPEWYGWLILNIETPNIQGVDKDVERIISGNY